jgi:quercetin dioxygenase-like cupin family protein
MSTLQQFMCCGAFVLAALTTRFVAAFSPAVQQAPVTASDTTGPFVYDQAKDGMLVAPQLTRKLGDTLGIRFYEVTVEPGDSIPWHMHPDHIFYVVAGGKAAIYFEGAGRQEWDLQPGMGFIHGPVMDAARNIGNTTLKFIVADIYRPKKNN